MFIKPCNVTLRPVAYLGFGEWGMGAKVGAKRELEFGARLPAESRGETPGWRSDYDSSPHLGQ